MPFYAGLLEGAGTVGEGGLYGGVKLSECLGISFGDEQGIIAETVGAAALGSDGAFAGAADGFAGTVGQGQGHYATKPGGSYGAVFKLTQQFAVVGFVIAVLTGVAGGEDPGGTVEGIDLEARIVGQGRYAGGPAQFVSLFQGIFNEGGAVFKGVRDMRKVECAYDFQLGNSQQFAYLAEFVLISCSND